MAQLTDLPNALLAAVQVGCAALDSNTSTGSPATCAVYHGAGGPPDDCCDFLIAWAERIYGTKNFPAEWPGVVERCNQIGMAADIAVKLRRPCWPVLSDAPPFFPQPAEFEPASVNLATDGMALWCGIFSDLSNRAGTIMGAVPGCPGFRMSTCLPDRNAGGCSGWTIRFTLDFGPCCIPAA